MDSELVTGSLSDKSARSESDSRFASRFPYTEVFNRMFPYYLSIGMSESQYWDQDVMLAKYYREAEELRMKRHNQEMWLQGMYIYDAIARLSPILRSFSKKGTKAEPYPKEPYPISKDDREEIKKKKEQENELKGKCFMEMYMAKANKYFDEKDRKK